jgi:archaellum component FlaC
MTNEIKRAEEAIKEAEMKLLDAKKHLEYLKTPKDTVLTTIKTIATNKLNCVRNVERRDSKIIMVDISDQVGHIIVFGSDFIDRVFEKTGYKAVAFDHQQHSQRYRVWFETTS